MTESNGNNLENQPTEKHSFEERVGSQLEAILTQLAAVQAEQVSLREEQAAMRTEMVERFIQLSRQIRDFDIKVDVYTREHSYMKDDIREVRAKVNLQ
ncbi:MAG: hypothetical protein M3X11_09855 [Acidobacteriota bacterium]|nr:hypothetical protein [Acidobacteriota bacterium]